MLALPLFVVLSTLSDAGTDASVEPPIRLLRDPYGVPHVLAKTDYGAGYGHGWAVAEDQLAAALSAFWTAQGRRTEIDGAVALPLDRSVRLLRMTEDVESAYADYPTAVRDVARGFADGINAYMDTHPDEVPTWAEPIEPTWPLGLGRLIQFIPVIQRANREVGRGPGKLSVLDTGVEANHYQRYGSNAWVLGTQRTENGAALMLTDPHLPWKHEFRLYEVHLRGRTFEVAGAAFLGVPLPAFGRNARVSWTWTWNSPDHADVYRLALDPDDRERYLFDGRSVPFTREEHRFVLPTGEVMTETLRWARHGPVTHLDAEEGYAIAPRLTVFGLTDVPTQMLEMIRARDVPALERAMERLAIPHFNLVAADVDGAMTFVWGGRVPNRPVGPDWSKPVDGTRSATLWSADDVVPWRSLPRTTNPAVGYLQNCNNHPDYTTGTADDPTTDEWPAGVVKGGQRDTVRAWYLRRRIAERERWTVAQARELAVDNYVIPHLALIPQLRRAWEVYGDTFPGRAKIAADVERLLAWDGRPTLGSAAQTLCLSWLFETFDHRAFLPTELLERDVDALDDEEMLKLLVGMVKARGVLDDLSPAPAVPWGLIHVIRKNGRRYPVESGMYPAVSLWNANLDLSAGLTGVTARVGSAYTALSVLDEPIRTWSITPLGQTDDERRPYCHASTRAYAARELKLLPFSDDQLAEVETTETVLTVR